MNDYSTFILRTNEKICLFKLRFIKHASSNFFGNHFSKFSKLHLIAPTSGTLIHGVYKPKNDYHLTSTYWEYIAYRRESYFKGKLPVIISIIALMKSYGFGIDDIILWCMQQLELL